MNIAIVVKNLASYTFTFLLLFVIGCSQDTNQDTNLSYIKKKNIGFQQLLIKILTKYSSEYDKNNIIEFFYLYNFLIK